MFKHLARPVHKFGGSSLANAERFRAIPELLPKGNELIVVSAIQGVTSLLQQALDEAPLAKYARVALSRERF